MDLFAIEHPDGGRCWSVDADTWIETVTAYTWDSRKHAQEFADRVGGRLVPFTPTPELRVGARVVPKLGVRTVQEVKVDRGGTFARLDHVWRSAEDLIVLPEEGE